MHFSRPNNRPPEQGSHWEESDCNLVHQTPKLPAIISSFLHQTQAYTDSQANLSCNTRERKRFGEWHFSRRAGEILHPWHMESVCVDRYANCEICKWAGERPQFHSAAQWFVEIKAWVDMEIIWYGASFQVEWYYKPETHRSLFK